MSKSKLKYKVYDGKSLKKLLENSRTLVLTIFFSAGIIFGAVILNKDVLTANKINDLFNNYIIIKTGQGISEVFFNSLKSNCIFIAVNIFLAFSLIGYPLLIWIPFLKGLGAGFFIGYIYCEYGLSGLGYNILTMLPGVAVSTYALIIACDLSCEYSENAYLKSITGKGQFEKGETKVFLLKQMIYIMICIASSLIDAVFSTIFLRFFEL